MTRERCTNDVLVEARRDGRLSAADVASLERHLRTCAWCSAHAADLERVGAALRADRGADVSPLEHRRARASLLRAAAAPPAPPRHRTALFVAAAAMLVAGVAVAGVAAVPRSRQVPSSALSEAPVPSEAPASTGSAAPAGSIDAPTADPAPSALTSAVPPVAPTAGPSVSVASRVEKEPRATVGPSSRAPVASPSPSPSSSTPPVRARALQDAIVAIERGDYGQASSELARARTIETDPERVELALYLHAVALQRAGRPEEAKLVASDYLARHPRGRFVREAARIAGAP